jgi:hypothetical protein
MDKTKNKIKMNEYNYIQGFKHGIRWFRAMGIASLGKYTINQGVLTSLETDFDNIVIDSKEAVKNLKKENKEKKQDLQKVSKCRNY